VVRQVIHIAILQSPYPVDGSHFHTAEPLCCQCIQVHAQVLRIHCAAHPPPPCPWLRKAVLIRPRDRLGTAAESSTQDKNKHAPPVHRLCITDTKHARAGRHRFSPLRGTKYITWLSVAHQQHG